MDKAYKNPLSFAQTLGLKKEFVALYLFSPILPSLIATYLLINEDLVPFAI